MPQSSQCAGLLNCDVQYHMGHHAEDSRFYFLRIVNFETLIYMKLYSFLILNKIQKYKKKEKKTKLALFPRRISSCKQDCLYIYIPQILTISDGMVKVTNNCRRNWSGNVMIGEGGGGGGGRRNQHVAQCCRNIQQYVYCLSKSNPWS